MHSKGGTATFSSLAFIHKVWGGLSGKIEELGYHLLVRPDSSSEWSVVRIFSNLSSMAENMTQAVRM